MYSIKFVQLWLVMVSISYVMSVATVVFHTPPAQNTLEAVLKEPAQVNIEMDNDCLDPKFNMDTRCTMDISDFDQEQADQLLGRGHILRPYLKCDKSNLSVLDFSKLTVLGHVNKWNKYPEEGNNDAFEITNNLNLKKIIWGGLKPCGDVICPGFFTIRNNPRLSRVSIDDISSLVEHCNNNATIRNKIKLQSYGECNYVSTTASTKSLTWEEFRWCRIIQNDVILTGDAFKSNLDTAYILHVNGTLTIKNTEITDLSMLPVYFKIDSGEISGNKLLCTSFEDEIRMKRLGFTMINNIDLSCRTDCQGGELSLEQVKLLKDCVTLKGGLYLDGIDDATAAADLFKTVRTIHGPVVIKNAKAIVDFKELKEIKDTGEEPLIKLEYCKYPILLPNLTKLEGTGASPMVVLKDARIDILKFLKKTYPDKIDDGLKKATANSVVTDRSTFLSSTKQPTIVTGTRASRVDVPPTETLVERTGNTKPDESKPAGRPGATITEVSTSDPSASVDKEGLKSSGGSNNSVVEGKKNRMFMVLTIASLVIFFASSVTSVGIVIKYNVM